MDQTVINLASYPRSGNSFFRLVAWKCFNVPNSTVYNEETSLKVGRHKKLTDIKQNGPVLIKTHYKPDVTTENPTIYLVRDPFACYCSLAKAIVFRTRKDEDEKESEDEVLEQFINQIYECHYGPWRDHIKAWVPRHDAVPVHFSDLIKHPVRVVQAALMAVLPADTVIWNKKTAPAYGELKDNQEDYSTPNPYKWVDKLTPQQVLRIAKNESSALRFIKV